MKRDVLFPQMSYNEYTLKFNMLGKNFFVGLQLLTGTQIQGKKVLSS